MNAQPIWNMELYREWRDYENELSSNLALCIPVKSITRVIEEQLVGASDDFLSYAIHGMFFHHRVVVLLAGEDDEQAEVLLQA